jgi:putative ABC transport system permease protein
MMDWKSEIKKQLVALRLAPVREAEIIEELAEHLEDRYREMCLTGASEEAATQALLAELSENELLAKELTHIERQLEQDPAIFGTHQRSHMTQDFWQDLRFGARMLTKNPGFTSIAVLTLALGIGANSAIFSFVNALLLRPLPYAQSERLVLLAERSREGKRLSASYPNATDWRARAESFEDMAASVSSAFNLTGGDRAARVSGRLANGNFFHLLGITPQLGRLFTEEDDRYGASRTAIISHNFWQKYFGGEADVLGKSLVLTGETYTVVGVLPPGFEYFEASDVYTPLNLFVEPDSGLANRGSSAFDFYSVARLKPGVSVEQANDEMAALGAQLAQEYPQVNEGKSAQAEPLQDVMSEGVRQSLWILLGAVGFILLIACINVANLLLVRVAERRKELAVRQALGAGRWRIVRQMLSESLLLTGLGGACGLLVGHWMLRGLLLLAPQEIPGLGRVGLDKSVLLFTLGLVGFTGFLCGFLPALQSSKTDLQTALKEGGRLSGGASREGMRRALLIAEVSLSLVLLVGAGLLVRSMYNLLHVDLGFDGDNLLTMRLNLQGGRYNPDTARIFYDEALTRVSAVPGVRAAAWSQSVPIRGSNWSSVFTVADKPAPTRADLPQSDYLSVSANYFETMGIRLMQGRGFQATDTKESPPVVVINETLARRMWPGENPIGKRIKQGFPEEDAPLREVIGVVNDLKLNGVEQETSMQTYLLLRQEPKTSLGLVVRTQGNPAAAAIAVEQAIHSLDKDLPVFAIFTMDQLLGNSLTQRRLTMMLLGSFAALALVLASVGIYGVIAYGVRQRTREIGIRLALGAQARDVLKMVLSQGLTLTLIGIGIGLVAAFALTRWMESLLFDVRPTDALTFGVIGVGLLLVALLASWIPARRATRVDPMTVLRHD